MKIRQMTGGFYSPADCQTAFDRLVNDKDFPIGVQFDWQTLK